MKQWFRRGWFIGCVLLFGLISIDSQAQIGVGFYDVHQGGQEVGKLLVVSSSSSGTTEHWNMHDGRAILRAGRAIEIRPADAAASAAHTDISATGAGVAWDARSEEETIDEWLSIADLQSWPKEGDLHVEVAEILQCRDCADENAARQTAPVAWVLESTDEDGNPVSQEWWLTRAYVYPSPLVPGRTFVRVLDESERADAARQHIVKRIAVALTPTMASWSPATIALSPTTASSSPAIALPPTTASESPAIVAPPETPSGVLPDDARMGCSSGRLDNGTFGAFVGGLVALFAACRRRFLRW